jgi:hypothetical protein
MGVTYFSNGDLKKSVNKTKGGTINGIVSISTLRIEP